MHRKNRGNRGDFASNRRGLFIFDAVMLGLYLMRYPYRVASCPSIPNVGRADDLLPIPGFPAAPSIMPAAGYDIHTHTHAVT